MNERAFRFVAVFSIMFLMCFYIMLDPPSMKTMMEILIVGVTGILSWLILYQSSEGSAKNG